MDTILKMFGVAVVFVGGIFLILPLGTLFGGIAGWMVGMFFGDTILGIAGQLGIKGVTMFQLGAFLGFVGAFLRTTVSSSSKA